MTDQTGVLWFLDACIAHGIPQERPDFQRVRNDVAELIAAVEHDFATRLRAPMAGPQELQAATDRVFAALEACKGGA